MFRFNPSRPAWREHICGLYYNISYDGSLEKTYLPQVELQAHATILATTSRTILTQTFVNPSTDKGIKEVRYTFPLYDGVSVVGFTCHVGDRTIVGEVKEKEKARAVFQEAIARGETAGLLEQLPDAADVFTTTVGNIPPGARVIIKITYLGELKHDMEVDGIRFTIPNIISPRYGNYPGHLRTTSAIDAMGGGISITVDAEMADGSFIQKIQSPTHPISMTIGTTSFAPNADPTMTKASATLALGTAQLDTDFVLQVIAKDTGVPKAILENHPMIPNHRALMATLVPKFALPAEKPEIVFVCDRSGSMGGSRITLAIQALKVFLKSLPVGVKFNICSFGSSYSYLWPKSVTYSQKTLDEAIRHAETFSASYGGTEMLNPLKATLQQRYNDMPLEVMLLTDGEIWNQQALFSYLNESITETKAPIRIFTLGIGNGVSHSLIEGIAKAGNGFSQTVGEGEKMDSKVVRMLKGALSPHVNDYTLEVKYSTSATSDAEDDFEIVEKVTDSLKVNLNLREKEEKKETVGFQSTTMRTFFTDYNQKKPISLFDTSADPDHEDPPAYDVTGEARYVHLPNVPVPRVLQAPQNIPSLFAFNRTTAYLLLGPDAPKATPKSVLLRGTSKHGPLELEIPIQTLELPGATIHQLAAKKAISELEQGRGWLSEAKDESGTLIKTKFEGRFDDMVEREAVRLGVQFQVGGKWCSFVAVESNARKAEDKEKEMEGWEWLEDEETGYSTQFEGPTSAIHDGRSSDDDSDCGFCLDDVFTEAETLNTPAKETEQDVDAQIARISQIQNMSANICTSPESEESQMASAKAWRQRQAAPRAMRRPGRSSQSSGSKTMESGISSAKKSQSFVGAIAQDFKSRINNFADRGERLEAKSAAPMAFSQPSQANKSFGGLFGSRSPAPAAPSSSNSSSFSTQSTGGALFRGGTCGFGSSLFGSSSSSGPPPPAPQQGISPTLFGSAAPGGVGGINQKPPPPPESGQVPSAMPQLPEGNHALQDYQMQLMLLEQQNVKRRLMARQEADGMQQQQQVHPGFGAARHVPAMNANFNVKGGSPAALIVPATNAPFGTINSEEHASLSMNFGTNDSSTLDNFDFDSFLHTDGDDKMDLDLDVGFANSTEAFGSAPMPPPAPAPAGANIPAFGAPPPPPPPPPAAASTPPFTFAPAAPASTTQTNEQLVHHLISLQTFEGSWDFDKALISSIQSASINLDQSLINREISTGVNKKHLATALVVAVFEAKLAEFRGSWELVVDKAKEWLEGDVGDAERIFERVRKVVL
ncbi:Nn.00g014210.m01.CDS01 [Neocucurbitaria sp. VM-36]